MPSKIHISPGSMTRSLHLPSMRHKKVEVKEVVELKIKGLKGFPDVRAANANKRAAKLALQKAKDTLAKVKEKGKKEPEPFEEKVEEAEANVKAARLAVEAAAKAEGERVQRERKKRQEDVEREASNDEFILSNAEAMLPKEKKEYDKLLKHDKHEEAAKLLDAGRERWLKRGCLGEGEHWLWAEKKQTEEAVSARRQMKREKVAALITAGHEDTRTRRRW